MNDPLGPALPWLRLAWEAFPASRHAAAWWRAARRAKDREAAEAMRRGSILVAQACPLHELPQDTSTLQAAEPLWCGCAWHRDVIYARDGKAQRVIRVRRRGPVTGTWLVASFADSGGPPGEEVLEQVREAFAMQERLVGA